MVILIRTYSYVPMFCFQYDLPKMKMLYITSQDSSHHLLVYSLGPVVQIFVSITSSLRLQSLCTAKDSHILSTKTVFAIFMFEILMNR